VGNSLKNSWILTRLLFLNEIKFLEMQILVGTKSFNPKFFLHKVHNDTPYADLLRGSNFLRYTLDQKSEALRSLVQDNFDRFVSAKNTIDTVYGEMKAQSLNIENDYGVRRLNKALSGT
jgi:exocyst complex component 2